MFFGHTPILLALNTIAEKCRLKRNFSLPEEAPKQKEAELGDSQEFLFWFCFVWFIKWLLSSCEDPMSEYCTSYSCSRWTSPGISVLLMIV